MSDRAFLRLGAGAAVAGGVLALVGNLLHPRYSTATEVPAPAWPGVTTAH